LGAVAVPADPSRADPSRTDSSRADPSRVDPSRFDPSRVDSSRAEERPEGARPKRATTAPRPRGGTGRGQPAGHVLALFDLDGTLLRAPDPVHLAAFDHALQAVFGADATVHTLPRSGRLDRALARAALAEQHVDGADDQRIHQVMTIMGRYYRLRVGAGDRVDWVLGGAIEVLRKLRAAGVATAVASGSAREVGTTKLEASGLADFFPVGAFGDEADDRADLLRQAVAAAKRAYGRTFLAANAVVVGDSPADVEAARLIGARVVAVATGRHTSDQLDEHGPDATFPDLTNADAIVRAIRG
jgi:beta-phosphoglucomutase-like phosphatase (HAD superfamily)